VLVFLMAACGSAGGSGASDSAAASVNGRSIPMSAYNLQVTVLRHNALNSDAGIDPCSGAIKTYAVFCHELKKTALDTLIAQEIVAQYARKHHIVISRSDFNREWLQVMTSQWKGDIHVARAYARSEGVTIADLQQFTRDTMLHDQVMYQVTKHMSPYADQTKISRIFVTTNKQLRTVRTLLRAHRPFNQIAATLKGNLGGPCAATQCGDLGWIPNAFVPAQQRAVVTSPPGTVTGPFVDQSGYTLILVEGHRPHLFMTQQQQLSMREKLFSAWLKEQEKKATVHRYVAT
jgi:parvulin-like peptidyl-prolyl isomerase